MDSKPWELVIYAGTDDEEVIDTYPTYGDATMDMMKRFPVSTQEDLGINIMKNGSTEY